jgi:adenylosuccinate lyase
LQSKLQRLIDAGGVTAERVAFHELRTRHDVIAFTTAVAEKVGPISRYVHFGLTSSDVVDTALSLVLQEAAEVLRRDIVSLLRVLRQLARRYRNLPTIGRSHGIFAEPTSFGLKFLGWYTEWRRNLRRFDAAVEGLRVGKLSGAVGVNAHWTPSFEKRVLRSLGLRREPVSTQVIPRDRHAEFLQCLALCGSSLERIAVELRHLQRSEVGEVLEGFAKGQKGSSAMPHKRNPISSENITGCARLLRTYAVSALENVPLWHERDISHSAVERVALPDATILFDYSLNRITGVLSTLVINKSVVLRNLKQAGPLVFSGHYLLALVEAGVTREDAYAWIQQCALSSLDEGKDFVQCLIAHSDISSVLSAERIRKLGSLKYQLRNVDMIFMEAFKKFISDERAQATTEYVLVLSVVVGLFVAVKNLLGPVIGKANEQMAKTIDKFFRSGGMYQFRVSK